MYRLLDNEGHVFCEGTLKRCRTEYALVFQMAVCYDAHPIKLFIRKVDDDEK